MGRALKTLHRIYAGIFLVAAAIFASSYLAGDQVDDYYKDFTPYCTNATNGIMWAIEWCALDWSVIDNNTWDPLTVCSPPNMTLEFYFDGLPEASATYDPKTLANYWSAAWMSGSINGSAGMQFKREHLLSLLDPMTGSKMVWGLDTYNYPYDQYAIQTIVEARNRDTNQSVPIVLGDLVDATGMFAMESGLFYPRSTKVPHDPTRIACAMASFITRQSRIMLFTMTLCAINWIITTAVIFVTVLAHLDIVKAEKTLLVLPASVILVLPGLRALWVGAPPYGTKLDDYGINRQMVLIALALIDLSVLVAFQACVQAKFRKPRADIESSPQDEEKAGLTAEPPSGAAESDLHKLLADMLLKEAGDQPVRRTTW